MAEPHCDALNNDFSDPDSSGAAGERPQHPAGPLAARELHPKGCLEPGHKPGGEQVS